MKQTNIQNLNNGFRAFVLYDNYYVYCVNTLFTYPFFDSVVFRYVNKTIFIRFLFVRFFFFL